MRCSRPARSSRRNQEPQPDIQRIAFGFRTLEASLPGRGPGHSVDGVAPLFRQSASSTLKALPATPNMRRPMPTAETTMHPAGTRSGECRLTSELRLDNPISTRQVTDAKIFSCAEIARARSMPPEKHCLMPDVDIALAHRSSAFRSDSGKRTYIITAKRMISSDVSK